ncbi:MAG TPA: dihydrofolate reductase family protein [Chitinophagales bacterium]|nr:dihydrofolate reductase family protein [Chitinophagales bacterium]
MRKLVQHMHVSLDGFVTDQSGGMGWIHVDDEIFDFVGSITKEADTGLYGRVTFGMMEGYWPTAADNPNASKHDLEHAQWYKAASKVVLSRTLQSALDKTQIVSDNLAEQIEKLKGEPGKNIIIFGSPGAAHSLMQANLVDEYWLFVNPVLIGGGKPLFANIQQKTNLRLIETKTFASGVVAMHYEVK